MVNFHDPAVLAAEFTAFINFTHCMDGLFLWEFLISLKFEWEHLTGKRKPKWSFLLYLISRWGALGTVACNVVGFNVTHRINCQQWILSNLIFAYSAFASASLLIALRVIAIWSPNRIVAAVTIGTSLTNIIFLIYGTVKVRAIWLSSGTCALENSFEARDNITVSVASDVILLIIMLVGLLRSRQTQYGIVRHLYLQGLIWLAAATLAEIPAAIFINLNLNAAWNLMFQNFAFYVMVICATRMYRDLLDRETTVVSFGPEPSSDALTRLRFRSTVPKQSLTATNNTTLPKSRFDASFLSAEDVELGLTTEKPGDEEAQSHRMPTLLSRDAQ